MAGLLAEPGDSEAETLRQALERDDEKGRQIREAFDAVRRVMADSSVVKAMTAATEVGSQLAMADQAIREMASAMGAIDGMAQHVKDMLSLPATGALNLSEESNLVSPLALKPREAYMLEAQQDAVEAIIGISTLQQQTLKVMGTQVEVLKKVQGNAAAQTRLNRLLLAVAGATLFSAIVIPIIVALVS